MEFGHPELLQVEGTRTVSIRTFAELVGSHESTIRNKYIKTGKLADTCIIRDGNGKVKGLDKDLALAQWYLYHPKPATDDDGQPVAEQKTLELTELQAESLRTKQLDNALKQRQVDLFDEKYRPVDEVEQSFTDFAAFVGDEIRKAYNKRKAKLTADDYEERRRIDEEMNALLRPISEYELTFNTKKPRRRRAAVSTAE